MKTKQCARCKQIRPVIEFSSSKSTPDGLWNYCKDCDRERRKGQKTNPAPKYRLQVYTSRVSAKYRKVKSTLTCEQWLDTLNESDGKCHYCGEQVGTDALLIDHVKPMSKGGANSIDNIVASCKFCNQSKHDKDKPLYYKLANARFALKRLDGHIELDTQYKRHWWKRLVESLTTESNSDVD